MNKKDMCKQLELIGWQIETDEVGDKVASFDLLDCKLQIIPDIRCIREEQRLAVSPALSTETFSSMCAKIADNKSSYRPLISAWKGITIKVPEVQNEHVMQISDASIAWAKQQDLQAALLEHASLPTNAVGAQPVWHLAALAILGYVSKLRSYHSSFTAGDRLNFVDYVTSDYIERALEQAEIGNT